MHLPFRSVSLLALVVCASLPSDAQTVTNVATLAALTDKQVASGVDFELTGTIVDHSLLPIIDDGTARISLNGSFPTPFAIGDVITAKGRTASLSDTPRAFQVTHFKRIGRVPPSPDIRADPELVSRGSYDFRRIMLTGLVTDTFGDEIDPEFLYIVLRCGTCNVYASLHKKYHEVLDLSPIIGARVTITGLCCPKNGGSRAYLGRFVLLKNLDALRVEESPVTDPDVYPKLTPPRVSSPDEISRLGPCRISGIVRAVWSADQFLLQDEDGSLHRIRLFRGQRQPRVGDLVTVGGNPTSDFYLINLTQAICKRIGHDDTPAPAPQPATPAQILNGGPRTKMIDTSFYGRAVRLQGTIAKPPSEAQDDSQRFLDCGTHIVPFDVSALDKDERAALEPGCRVEISGVCLMDIDNWQPTAPFPRIRGFSLIVRTPEDVRILSRPTWWTTGRLVTAIGSLILVILTILIWNRVLKRLVDRRSRELFREQIAHAGAELKVAERMRLAVELHDSLSQNLTGVACQITATRSMIPAGPQAVAEHLDTAERMLTSCRTELKRCLWDLREDTLEDASLSDAIYKTVSAVIGDVRLTVRFNVPRSRISDLSVHSILCIIRELATNAVLHGRATDIKVAGESHDGLISFSVSDNGTGFVPERCPGVAEGHFGLEGIRERIKRMNGDFILRSAPGKGTHAKITVRLPHPENPSAEERPGT